MSFIRFITAGRRRFAVQALLTALAAAALTTIPASLFAADATGLLRGAFDNWRAKSSATTIEMTIHRPSWERHLTMKAWTRGDDDALVRFTAPAKDAGNATLKIGPRTYVFNPKLNQVVNLPASLMAQSWMGSDFSYNDLSKAEDILTKYTHQITDTGTSGGHTLYTIEATPKPGAPVVWGKQVVKVRDDGILIEQTFYDQDMKPVRTMTTDKVGRLGGRAYPVQVTMTPANKPGNWTRLVTTQGQFNISLPGYTFTRSNLENPRD